MSGRGERGRGGRGGRTGKGPGGGRGSSSCSDVLSVLNGFRRHEGPDMLSAWGGWGYSSNRYSFPITNPSKDGSKLEKVNFNFEK